MMSGVLTSLVLTTNQPCLVEDIYVGGGCFPPGGWCLRVMTLVGGSDAMVATLEGEAAQVLFGRQHRNNGGFSLVIWMARGLTAGRPSVGVALAPRLPCQDLEASCW
jgi:hypothetical protein